MKFHGFEENLHAMLFVSTDKSFDDPEFLRNFAKTSRSVLPKLLDVVAEYKKLRESVHDNEGLLAPMDAAIAALDASLATEG